MAAGAKGRPAPGRRYLPSRPGRERERGSAPGVDTGAAVAGALEIAKGMKLDEAMKLTRDDVANELGGLPAIKKHCSNLAADALREAVKDYREKNKK